MDREEVWAGRSQTYQVVYGSDEEGGTVVKKPPRRKNAVRVNATAVSQMIRGLLDNCYTSEDFAEMSGLSIQTVRHYLKTLKKAGAVHIVDWTEDARGVRSIKVWGIGDKPDAKKPTPLTSKELCRKYREKKKQIKLLQQMTGQNK